MLDDLVEAIEVPDARWALGVQWHPEVDPRSRVVRVVRGRSRPDPGGRVACAAARSRRSAERARGDTGRLPVPGPSARLDIFAASVPRSTAIRAAACTVLAAGLAAPLLRRRLRLKPPVVIAAAAATPFALAVLSRARARATSAMCALQMYAYVATYQMPNDDPEKLRDARAGRVSGQGGPRRSAAARRRRCACSARFGTPGRFGRWEKVLVWSHWVWFAFPHGTVAYVLLTPPRPVPGGRGADLRDVRPRRHRLLGDSRPLRPGSRPSSGLMEDGRTPELRRMMVEYGEQFWKQGWAPLYGVLGGNPLAAMPSLHFATSVTAAHVLSDTGPRRGRARLDLRRHARASRSSISASTTSSISLAGLALAESIRAATPRLTPARARLSRRAAGTRGQGARHDTRAGADGRRARRPATTQTKTTIAASSSTAARVLTLCGFLAAMILGLYLLLPQLAGLEDTWSRIEDGSPGWIVLAFVLTFGMFGGYVAMFRGVFGATSSGSAGARAT